jgi:hypothetical protein
VANSLSPVLKQKFFTNNGKPAAGYKIFTYEAGTNTKLDTYQSVNGAANANPIILDFRGEANIWLPPNVAYKLVYSPPNDTDPPTAPIWTVDEVVDSQLVTLWGGVDTGIANAYVLDFTANFTSYTDGIVIYWLPSNTNTGPSTINVNGLGPVALVNQDGSALAAGQVQANQIAQILYKGTGFVLLSSLTVISTGTFPITFTTGYASPLPGTLTYTRFGNTVTLSTSVNISGTSNSTALVAQGIPIGLRPSGNVQALSANLIDNGVVNKFGSVEARANGELLFGLWTGVQFSASAFTASGTKGLLNGWQISYVL